MNLLRILPLSKHRVFCRKALNLSQIEALNVRESAGVLDRYDPGETCQKSKIPNVIRHP